MAWQRSLVQISRFGRDQWNYKRVQEGIVTHEVNTPDELNAWQVNWFRSNPEKFIEDCNSGSAC